MDFFANLNKMDTFLIFQHVGIAYLISLWAIKTHNAFKKSFLLLIPRLFSNIHVLFLK